MQILEVICTALAIAFFFWQLIKAVQASGKRFFLSIPFYFAATVLLSALIYCIQTYK